MRQPKKAEITILTQAIKDRIKDPESLQLRRVMARTDNGIISLCGEANSKNSYGGYVGCQPFFVYYMVTSGSTHTEPSVVGLEGGTNGTVAVNMCRKIGYESRA